MRVEGSIAAALVLAGWLVGFGETGRAAVFDVAASRGSKPDVRVDTPAWQPPDAATVRAALFAWLEERGADEATQSQAAKLWERSANRQAGTELLDRLVGVIALVETRAKGLLDLCAKPRADRVPPSPSWLADPETRPLASANLRLFYARWLVHESLYDEAHRQLDGLEPADVVDPASLLFYQAVVNHRLLHKKVGTEAAEKLLAGKERSPRRYAAVARLMLADLEGLEVDSLDHIARRMEDVERRLDLGRAGPKVRGIEKGVIESLDKLIKKLEAQQQQQASAQASGNMQPSQPAQESRIMGGKGPGEVTKRDIGDSSGWGNLPPKKREEALQQIGREFPAHYRDVIEQYFRKLAGEGSE